ncbi:MAG: FoF1 ATP synthase subunit a [Eubacteriales bacterium]
MGTAVFLASSNWFIQFLIAFRDQFIESLKIGNIGEDISKAILQQQQNLYVGKVHILLTDAVIVTWVAVAIFCALWIWIAAKRERVPSGRQLVSESVVDLFLTLCKSNGMNQKQAESVAPFLGSICFFLIACNLASAFKIAPPAKNIAFPIALALFTVGYVIFTGIRFVGIKGFWASLIDPMPAMLPFKLLDYLIKPMSLSLRLFGNVFGAFILMEFIYIVIPVAVPGILGLWFDIIDGLLQAAIFTYLATTYIGEIIEGAELAVEKKHERDKKLAV